MAAYPMHPDDKAIIMKIIKKYGYEPDNILKRRILAITPDKGELVRRPKITSDRGEKMNMGGMMSSTKKTPTGSATGLTGMKGGGMMKKKGYAKGGMKKKGYAMGGAMKKPTAGQKGLKKLPTTVRNKMGYMAKGGMSMKKKGMAKGGAARRGR